MGIDNGNPGPGWAWICLISNPLKPLVLTTSRHARMSSLILFAIDLSGGCSNAVDQYSRFVCA